MAVDGDPAPTGLVVVFGALTVASVVLPVRLLGLMTGSGDDGVDATGDRAVGSR